MGPRVQHGWQRIAELAAMKAKGEKLPVVAIEKLRAKKRFFQKKPRAVSVVDSLLAKYPSWETTGHSGRVPSKTVLVPLNEAKSIPPHSVGRKYNFLHGQISVKQEELQVLGYSIDGGAIRLYPHPFKENPNEKGVHHFSADLYTISGAFSFFKFPVLGFVVVSPEGVVRKPTAAEESVVHSWLNTKEYELQKKEVLARHEP